MNLTVILFPQMWLQKILFRLNENKSLKEYKPGNMAMVIPLGRNGGASQLPNGLVAGSFLTKSIKGKDMLTSRYWKLMKQKMPTN